MIRQKLTYGQPSGNNDKSHVKNPDDSKASAIARSAFFGNAALRCPANRECPWHVTQANRPAMRHINPADGRDNEFFRPDDWVVG